MTKIRTILESICTIVKCYLLLPVALWKYRGRVIWLISERGTDARDNGYHFFKYLREHHPEIEAYYVITEDSSDRDRVAALGDVVRHGSLQHYLMFLAAEYKISTHILGFVPNLRFSARVVPLLPRNGKRIFLQHGVIGNDMPALYREKTGLDIFVCGAKPEYDHVATNFHYIDEVKYTGLARYDALHNAKEKNQILLMPTWRLYLSKCTEPELSQSEYVTRWNAVLRDSRLLEALRRFSKTLAFYPHYEVQKKFLHLLSTNDPAVIIADFDHYDVQQLLKESQLLVTDYSSVAFDFAYMKKPCVYYQFDEEQFFSGHYRKGYFDYREMGFGEVLTEHDALVETIISYLESNCQTKAEYARRMDDFFPLHDTNNCKRIYEEIQKL